MRSLFRLVVLKCMFMSKSNSLCKSEELVVFFWYGQGQKGLVELKYIHIFNGLEK